MRRGKNEKKQELTGSDFEYVLVLGEELSPQNCRGYVENLRKEGDKLGLRFVPTGDDWRVIMVAATVEALGRQAEQISLLKPLIRGLQPTGPFVYEIRQDFVGWGSQGFFLPCERSHLTYMLLLNMKGIDISGVPYVLITRLEHDGVIEAVFPAHDHVETKKLLQKSFFRRGESERDGLGFLGDLASVVFSPVNGIREYYGSEVAFYFAWLDFFTLWLLAPSLVGFSLWYFRGEYTVDDSPYIPFFSLFVIFWSALYIKYWDRQASDFACRWGTLDAARKESIRPQFEGEIRTSPITGKPEIYFSAYHRIPLYTFSFAVTLVALGIAGIVMGLFLNLEGYVHKDSPIYVPWLAKRAEPGGFFFVSDNDGLWQNIVGMVPVVLHSSVILGLNSLYRYIAEWLTEVENHRTEHEHEDSLIIKRFLFEAFDCYMALFYIAFYELNPIHLRKELISLYCVDSLRRVACECALPLVLQKATALVDSLIQKPPLSNKKDDNVRLPDDPQEPSTGHVSGAPPSSGHVASVLVDLSRDEYEQFDDYMEMVIEFGYITLFAAAFPLAPLLSIICNVVELKSDAFKLSLVCRRPHAHRARDIGIWRGILVTIFVLSIMTNCMMFGFTTEQMMVWIPSWFELEKDKKWDGHVQVDQHLAKGKGRFVVLLVFGLEHILMLLCGMIFAAIPSHPGWVRVDIARREHQAEQALKKLFVFKDEEALESKRSTTATSASPTSTSGPITRSSSSRTRS